MNPENTTRRRVSWILGSSVLGIPWQASANALNSADGPQLGQTYSALPPDSTDFRIVYDYLARLGLFPLDLCFHNHKPVNWNPHAHELRWIHYDKEDPKSGEFTINWLSVESFTEGAAGWWRKASISGSPLEWKSNGSSSKVRLTKSTAEQLTSAMELVDKYKSGVIGIDFSPAKEFLYEYRGPVGAKCILVILASTAYPLSEAILQFSRIQRP